MSKLIGNITSNNLFQVLALPQLLDVVDRVDWKLCPETDQEECAIAAEIRDKFTPYETKFGEVDEVDPEFG
jgi:hypothetical protein